MPRLILYCLSSFLFLQIAINTSYQEGPSVSDLLEPILDDKSDYNQETINKVKQERNIDEILGPKDIFPFLPGNHRDSGTGKFNSF